ncbi:MAG: hypothetical protein R2932_30840 [Caldilineaceae bacterium]
MRRCNATCRTLRSPIRPWPQIVRQLLNRSVAWRMLVFLEMRLPTPATLTDRMTRRQDARAVQPLVRPINISNPNYQILARLVEVVSGEPFSGYLQMHIFAVADERHRQPAGLRQIWLRRRPTWRKVTSARLWPTLAPLVKKRAWAAVAVWSRLAADMAYHLIM